ncbi:MAG: carbon storage regulator [Oscillospiraceae bacterium]|nr:carbon storage regulator [Oscillospiraceae bacterium]
MLSLRVKSGEYITIGNDIIVQIFREGTDARVEVKAPRELTILRGEVLERTEQKPDGLFAKCPKSSAHLTRDAKNKEKLTARKAYFASQQAEDERRRNLQTQELLAIAADMGKLTEQAGDAQLRMQLQTLAERLFRAATRDRAEEM